MELDEESPFRHFSHEHQLEQSNSPKDGNITCYGCNLNIFPGRDNCYFNCQTCRFSLHKVCYNMPRNIRHPADPDHILLLLATPSSAKSTFKCKACTQNLTAGFYYFCAKCGDHYHTLCSIMPIYVTIPSHSHSVQLEFSPPYDFQCDLCKKPGYSGWLYRCGMCDYDVHLACTIFKQASQLLQHQDTIKNIDMTNGSSGDSDILHRATPDIDKACLFLGKDSQSHSSTPFSEDHTVSSFQLSDAYFSIDLSRCPREDSPYDTTGSSDIKKEKNGTDHIVPNKLSEPKIHPYHQKGQESGKKGAISSIGVDARVWDELGQENSSRKGIGLKSMSDLKDQTSEPDKAHPGGCSWLCCN